MIYNPDRHHRRSIRLRGYDYTQEGAYYITLCTQNRARLFGTVRDGRMVLSEAGKIVEREWLRTLLVRPNVDLDAFVVMPDHLHAILLILRQVSGEHPSEPGVLRSASQSLGAIVRGFKAAVTQQLRVARDDQALVVWQRNYYEHIVRGEADLARIRRYIEANPARWSKPDP